jgi:hypothetical protein
MFPSQTLTRLEFNADFICDLIILQKIIGMAVGLYQVTSGFRELSQLKTPAVKHIRRELRIFDG